MRTNTRIREGQQLDGADMTPMIDLVFLLLVFFILTTTFIQEEKMLSMILPTQQGSHATQTKEVEKLEEVLVRLYPVGLVRQQSEKYYQEFFDAGRHLQEDRACLQIGNEAPLIINGAALALSASQPEIANKEIERIHNFIAVAMQKYEHPGAVRNEQAAVIIKCFSGLPWKYAILAFDAVRNYENQFQGTLLHGQVNSDDPGLSSHLRSLNFAAPQTRNYGKNAHGSELFELLHSR